MSYKCVFVCVGAYVGRSFAICSKILSTIGNIDVTHRYPNVVWLFFGKNVVFRFCGRLFSSTYPTSPSNWANIYRRNHWARIYIFIIDALEKKFGRGPRFNKKRGVGGLSIQWLTVEYTANLSSIFSSLNASGSRSHQQLRCACQTATATNRPTNP